MESQLFKPEAGWLKVSDLLEQARKKAGIADFGDPWFLDPLSQLVDMINREAGLPSVNGPSIDILVQHLVDRLRIQDYLKRYPAILEEKVEVAGVIIAHARGGSTLLQSLLTASPQLTAPRLWEMITPVPLPDEAKGDFGRRVQMGRDWINALQSAAPEVKSVHPMDAMAYDEEMLLVNHSFLGFMFSSYFNIPSFNIWIMEQDHTRAYEELKIWLQLLQYQDRDRRGQKWLLKSVQHLMTGNLTTLLKIFPEAKLLMTHRNLENVIGSLCSAQAMLIGLSGSTTADQKVLGPTMVEAYLRALKSMIKVREEQPAGKFIDIKYQELVSDPIGQFRRVMGLMDLPVHAGDVGAAEAWMKQHPRGSFPPHVYHLENYGLTQQVVARAFQFYHEAYLVSHGTGCAANSS